MRIVTLTMAATVLDWLGIPAPDSIALVFIVGIGMILAVLQDFNELFRS